MITFHATRDADFINSAGYTSGQTYTSSITVVTGGEIVVHVEQGETGISSGNAHTDSYTGENGESPGNSNSYTNYFEAGPDYSYESGSSVFVDSSTNTTISNSASTAYTTSFNSFTYIGSANTTFEYDYTTTTTYETSESCYSSTSASTSVYNTTGTHSTTTCTTTTSSYNVTLTSNESLFTTSVLWQTAPFVSATPATSSDVLFTITTVATSGTASGAVDFGTVVIAQDEWLWSYTATPNTDSIDTSLYLASQVAGSFTRTTFWPVTGEDDIPYNSGGPEATGFNNDDSVTTFTAQSIAYTSCQVTISSGDMFPRDTIALSTTFFEGDTMTISSAYINTYTYTDGVSFAAGTNTWTGSTSTTDTQTQSNTTLTGETAIATCTSSFVQLIQSTTTLTTCYGLYLLDVIPLSTTATLTCVNLVTQSYTESIVDPNEYWGNQTTSASNGGTTSSFSKEGNTQVSLWVVSNPNFSTSGSSTYTIYSVPWWDTISETVTNTNYWTYNEKNYMASYFEPLSPVGFKNPFSMGQTASVFQNFSLDTSIYYPFTSSVLEGVTVPIPTNASTMQTNFGTSSTTDTDLSTSGTYYTATSSSSSGSSSSSWFTGLTSWNYKWSSETLGFTSATSQTASYAVSTTTFSYSSWDTVSTTASLASVSAETNEVWRIAPCFGGFPATSTSSMLAQFYGAGNGLSFDSSSSTTTDNLNSSILTSVLNSTVYKENSESYFITSASASTNGTMPFISFTRDETTTV